MVTGVSTWLLESTDVVTSYIRVLEEGPIRQWSKEVSPRRHSQEASRGARRNRAEETDSYASRPLTTSTLKRLQFMAA